MKVFKKILLFLIITFIQLTSCSDDNEYLNDCKIISCSVSTLTYPDINQVISYNQNFSGKIYFEYDDQNRINKILGGPVRYLTGANSYGYYFTDDVETTVSYDNNDVIIENASFLINDNKLNSRKLTNSFYNIESEYFYKYKENLIQEILNDKVNRTFYFTNNNLSKVEQIIYSLDYSTIRGKKELIFSDYDNNENFLKGLFFINGAFYKAFSDNNFKTIEYKTYDYINDEFELDLDNGYSISFDFEVNNNGIVDIFELECN